MNFLEHSSNRNCDTTEKIHLSPGKVPLVIKSTKTLKFIVTNVLGMPDMYFKKHPSHGSRDTAQKFS